MQVKFIEKNSFQLKLKVLKVCYICIVTRTISPFYVKKMKL
jgi:hypothetical protein